MRLAVGIGCDRGTSRETLEAALNEALEGLGLDTTAVDRLASIDRKADEAGLLALAETHGWPLRFYPAETLAGIPVPNPSEVVRRHMGTPAVAEAAAMLAAGRDGGDWLIEKFKYRGDDGRHATISIVGIDE